MLRKFHVLIIAIALAASGMTGRAHAASPGAGVVSAHEMHHVERYADLAIEPGADCDHAMPSHDSSGKAPCDNCCAACVTASMIAVAPAQIVLGTSRSEVLSVTRPTLIGRTVPIDPGIPKPSRT